MLTLLSKMLFSSLSVGESIVNWYQDSLIKELLDYFNEQYFSVRLGSYENFSVDAGTGATLRNIILALAAAIIVAALTTAYTRVRIGNFVRKVLTENCLTPEQAKTLMELGYFRDASIRRALSKPSVLHMVVRRVGDGLPDPVTEGEERVEADAPTEEPLAPSVEAVEVEITAKNASRVAKKTEKIDFTTARFYIPEAICYRVEARFDPNGSGWRSAVIVSIASVVVAALLCFFVPELVQFADNLIGWLGA